MSTREQRSKLKNNDLIKLYQQGDDLAFQEFYSRYADKVSSRLNSMVKYEKDIIPDIFQEIWMAAAKYAKEGFKFNSCFSTYLYTIVHSRAINYFRKEARHTRSMNQPEHDVFDQLMYSTRKPFDDHDSGTGVGYGFEGSLEAFTIDFEDEMYSVRLEQVADKLNELLSELTDAQRVAYDIADGDSKHGRMLFKTLGKELGIRKEDVRSYCHKIHNEIYDKLAQELTK